MRILKKLASRRGETLTETLVGVLIVGLASVALASMVVASSNMNAAAIKADEALYKAVSRAEGRTPVEDGGTGEKVTVEVTVGEGTIPHKFESALCGDKDLPLWSYSYHKVVTPP